MRSSRPESLKIYIQNRASGSGCAIKADPESKGPIENSVEFVKKNFFSARKIICIDDVWRSLPGWMERKNRRIHRSPLLCGFRLTSMTGLKNQHCSHCSPRCMKYPRIHSALTRSLLCNMFYINPAGIPYPAAMLSSLCGTRLSMERSISMISS